MSKPNKNVQENNSCSRIFVGRCDSLVGIFSRRKTLYPPKIEAEVKYLPLPNAKTRNKRFNLTNRQYNF